MADDKTGFSAAWAVDMERHTLTERLDAVATAALAAPAIWKVIDQRCGADWAWDHHCYPKSHKLCVAEQARFVTCAENVMRDHGVGKR